VSYKTAYTEIMRVYEADRDRAGRLLAQRKKELYTRCPRILEIDTELRLTGIAIAKHMIAGDHEGINALREKTSALRKEKESLLLEAKIPEDYFTDIYKCGKCNDTGFVQHKERCSCLKQRLTDKYYDLCSIRNVLEKENFDTFDLRLYSNVANKNTGISPKQNMKSIFKAAMGFVDNFDEKFQNMLFYGDTGVGKTFLCNCIAKDLLDKGYSVLYVTAPRIFKVIEDFRFNRENMKEPDYAIEAITDVDLLILDDLGAEFSTILTSSELFGIINQRLLSKKSTVISTNLLLPDFETQYSDRIVSRFLGYYTLSKFYGEDIRAKIKHRK